MTDEPSPSRTSARIWRFGDFVFDEASWVLSAHGRSVALEAKPLEILLELLRHAGEVVTKGELLDSVWPDVTVVEGSLTTAVSKLRKALGDEDGAIIATVPKIGYRLIASVTVGAIARDAASGLDLRAGEVVPGRPAWRLDMRLTPSSAREVWSARHDKTGELRIFKFATDADQLRRLKREVAISRLLHGALGDRPDLPRVLEWNFDARPWFLETAYGGSDLPRWAEEQGGLDAIPLEIRIGIVASVAETVAAAHELGVLHRDMKPANILAAVDRTGAWQAKVVDFGNADLDDHDRFVRAGITASGFDDPGQAEAFAGTAMWMAPELLTGAAPSVRSDIYALGVILYQIVVGDFRKSLSPGWEADIVDPVLRDDIAAAAAGDPALRLDGAAELAAGLRTLAERKRARAQQDDDRRRVAELERRIETAKARRPWIAALAAVFAIGAVVSTATAFVALQERDRAQLHAGNLEAMNQFLASDLLARASPYVSGRADETLIGAINASAGQIDTRFARAPEIAAHLHHAIARALDSRNAWPDARRGYERAAELWDETEGGSSSNAARVRLQRAMMEARSYQGGSLETARALLGDQEAVAAALNDMAPDLPLWLASARGMVALIGDDAIAAEANFREAIEIGETLPDFDAADLLTLKQRRAFALIRLGRSADAEPVLRDLIAGHTALSGAKDPATLRVRLNLSQALMGQGRHEDAIAEADSLEPLLHSALGLDNEFSLQLLATRAQSAGALERWDDAIRDTERLRERAIPVYGEGSFFAIVALSDKATAECRAGRTDAGTTNSVLAHEEAMEAFGPDAGLTQGVAFARAHCLVLAERYGEAGRYLEGIDVAKVAALAADPDWGANVALARAHIAYAAGDYDATRRFLANAARFAHSGAEAFQKRRWRQLNERVSVAAD